MSIPDDLVSHTFLGQPCVGGISSALRERLILVEQQLQSVFASDPGPINSLTGEPTSDFFSWCGIREPHGGFRENQGFHATGAAIDINYHTNPYIVTQSGENLGGEAALKVNAPDKWRQIRQASVDAYSRAIQFDSLTSGEISAFDVSGRHTSESTSVIYARFMFVSNAIRKYLGVAFQQSLTEINRPAIVDPGTLSLEELLARIPDTERRNEQEVRDQLGQILAPGTEVQEQYRLILLDYEMLRVPLVIGSPIANPQLTRNPANGFLDLRQEIVLALCDDPGRLRWGISDFGASESGDVMHFDLAAAIFV
jgi:hypothetical protein